MTKTMNNEHLTIDEILEFISFQKITPEAMTLVSRVNDHILECKDCFDKVSAFQLVQDKFEDGLLEKYSRGVLPEEVKIEIQKEI